MALGGSGKVVVLCWLVGRLLVVVDVLLVPVPSGRISPCSAPLLFLLLIDSSDHQIFMSYRTAQTGQKFDSTHQFNLDLF